MKAFIEPKHDKLEFLVNEHQQIQGERATCYFKVWKRMLKYRRHNFKKINMLKMNVTKL